MTLATAYATALYKTRTSDVRALSDTQLLKNLRGVLARRGHQGLLPGIYAEYQKLRLRAARAEAQQRVTPEQERTRALLELYRKLIHV